MIQRTLIQYVATLLFGIVIGATVNGWRLDSQISDLKAEHAVEIAGIVQAASTAATEALERQQAAQATLSRIDTQYTQELNDALAETDRLRSAVADSRRQLRIQATCPDPGSNPVRSTTTPASVDDDAGARLTPAAERNYWTLRERITTITAQLSACQAYARSVSGQ